MFCANKGETKDLRVSVEELRGKEGAWKDENERIKEHLRQVDQLTGKTL